MPSPDEGYDHIIYLRPADHPRPEYTRDDILSILKRLKVSTRDAGTTATQRGVGSYLRHSGNCSRTNRARGYRGGDGYQGSSRPRGTLYGSSRFASRVGGVAGSNNSNWRSPSSGQATNPNREGSDRQRSAAVVNVPAMEGSKGSSAEERHNST
jgi:hypothetical protein